MIVILADDCNFDRSKRFPTVAGAVQNHHKAKRLANDKGNKHHERAEQIPFVAAYTGGKLGKGRKSAAVAVFDAEDGADDGKIDQQKQKLAPDILFFEGRDGVFFGDKIVVVGRKDIASVCRIVKRGYAGRSRCRIGCFGRRRGRFCLG